MEWLGKIFGGIGIMVSSFVGGIFGTYPPLADDPAMLPPPIQINTSDKESTPRTTSQSGSQKPSPNLSSSSQSTKPSTPVVASKPSCTISINGGASGSMPTIKTGEDAVVSWSSKNADSASWASLSPLESATPSGSRSFPISVNASEGIWSQAIAFTNKHGTTVCHAEAKIVRGANTCYSAGQRTPTAQTSAPLPTATVTADKKTITIGDSVTITWSSTNADYGTWSDTIPIPTSGTKTFTNVASSRSFNMIFYGAGGTAGCAVYVFTPGYVPGGKQ